jgi:hypothetical protein
MKPTSFTTERLNRRSSQKECLNAIRECTKLSMKQYKTTGFIGNSQPDGVKEAFELSLKLSVEDARRHAGSKVPGIVAPKAPERPMFLHQEEMRPMLEKVEEDSKWQIDPQEIIQEILSEEKAESEARQVSDLLGDDEGDKPKTTSQKIHDGLRERRMSGKPEKENLSELQEEALAKKDPDELTPIEKIRRALSGASYRTDE